MYVYACVIVCVIRVCVCTCVCVCISCVRSRRGEAPPWLAVAGGGGRGSVVNSCWSRWWLLGAVEEGERRGEEREREKRERGGGDWFRWLELPVGIERGQCEKFGHNRWRESI